MTSLSDTQGILLSTASQREGGSLLPLPASLKPGGGATKALDALAKRGLAEARDTSDPAAVRRTDGDLKLGLFITAAGLATIWLEQESGSSSNDGSPDESPPAPTARTSKSATVLALLARPEGATLPELVEATGWLPHTTRAALTGLRKKGHAITRSKRGEVACYAVAAQ